MSFKKLFICLGVVASLCFAGVAMADDNSPAARAASSDPVSMPPMIDTDDKVAPATPVVTPAPVVMPEKTTQEKLDEIEAKERELQKQDKELDKQEMELKKELKKEIKDGAKMKK